MRILPFASLLLATACVPLGTPITSTTPAAPLQLFDALGRLARTQPAPAAGTETTLSLSGLPAGLYALRCGELHQRLTVE